MLGVEPVVKRQSLLLEVPLLEVAQVLPVLTRRFFTFVEKELFGPRKPTSGCSLVLFFTLVTEE